MSSNQKMTSGYFRKYGFAPAMIGAEGDAHSFLTGLTRSPRIADVLWLKWDSPRFDMKSRSVGTT